MFLISERESLTVPSSLRQHWLLRLAKRKRKKKNMIRNCVIFSMSHWWPSAGLSVCSFTFLSVCICVCVSVCSPGMTSKGLVRMRHLLMILRSWFNKLLPQGGLVSLLHSALWMKVDDTSWFRLAEEKCPTYGFHFLKVIWMELHLKHQTWDHLQRKTHSNQPNGE